MPVSEETYLRLACEDPDHKWELHHGRLWDKQPMTWGHQDAFSELGFQLRSQLDRAQFAVHYDVARLRRSETQYYMPDVIVIPRETARRLFSSARALEVYPEPLPLVVEVWSPSTGNLDVDTKLPEYQWRGDLEIWRIHPYDKTLTAWVRQPDGGYTETVYGEGIVCPTFLPDVRIDLDALFGGLQP